MITKIIIPSLIMFLFSFNASAQGVKTGKKVEEKNLVEKISDNLGVPLNKFIGCSSSNSEIPTGNDIPTNNNIPTSDQGNTNTKTDPNDSLLKCLQKINPKITKEKLEKEMAVPALPQTTSPAAESPTPAAVESPAPAAIENKDTQTQPATTKSPKPKVTNNTEKNKKAPVNKVKNKTAQ